MRRGGLAWVGIFVCAVAAGGAGPCDCTKDDDGGVTGVEMVRLRGIVFNIDTGERAEGVRVQLLNDPSISSPYPTGFDGVYEITVPAGTDLVFIMDDWDTSATDDWFPFIHLDAPTINVDDLGQADKDSWVLHACPQTHAPDSGSVAVWDNYLENADDQSYGNIYSPRSSAESGGILALPIGGCQRPLTTLVFHDSMTVNVSSPSCPVSYMKEAWFDSKDPALGPDAFYPPGHAMTDSGGFAVVFCDSAFTDTTVTISMVDNKPDRGLAWTPFECPVRKGTISLVFTVSIDGVGDQTFRDALRCATILPGARVAAAPIVEFRR